MNDINYDAAFEAMLFASGDAVELERLAAAVELDKNTARKIIETLREKYAAKDSGIRIIRVNDAYQMCTEPRYHTYIKSLVDIPKRRALTTTLLETLAIIAYKQPVTKQQIEEIRGVNADHAVNRLLEYNLICEAGRLNTAGKPILFVTTDEFLRHFGYESLEDLPR